MYYSMLMGNLIPAYLYGVVIIFFTLSCTNYLLGSKYDSSDHIIRIVVVSVGWPIILPISIICSYISKAHIVKKFRKQNKEY